MLFYGQQRLEFSKAREEEPETGLYLILAANNAGKTSFIRALKFLFYGPDAIGGGVTPGSVVCQKALAETQSNECPRCYVAARVVHRGSEYTLRRELLYKRSTSKTRAVILHQRAAYIAHNPTKDVTENDPDKFSYRIAEMVPEELFNFFFFKGEELSSKLLEGEEDHVLQDALMAIFNKEDWDLAEEHFRDLQKKYHAKVVAAQKKNAAASELVEEKEKFAKNVKDYQSLLNSLRDAHREKKAAFEEHEKQILAAAGSKHENLKTEIESLKSHIKVISSNDDEYHRRLFHEINNVGPIMLISSAFRAVRQHLETLEHKKILPAVVAEDFFSHLLKEKICICDRPLSIGSVERKNVEQRRAVCLSANVGQSLRNLSASVNPENAVGLPQKAVRGLASIRREIDKIDEIRSKKLDLEEDLRIRKDKLEALPESDLQALVQQKKPKEKELRELERKITNAEFDEVDAEQSLSEIEQQLDEMGVSGQANSEDLQAEKLCGEFAMTVSDMRDGLRDSFSTKLEKSVSYLYKQIVTDQSEAKIDSESLLPSINLHGQSGIAVGGAQSQALCLAYILSLAQLRREVAAELKELFYRSKTPISGDQAFVMDSVFAPMQGNYVRETAEFLPGKAKQLIMLLSAKQFDEKVQKTWSSKRKKQSGPINKAWCFLLHMPAEKYQDIEEDERIAAYNGKTVELLVPLTKSGHQFNQIQPL